MIANKIIKDNSIILEKMKDRITINLLEDLIQIIIQ